MGTRSVPSQFSEGKDDLLVKSLIQNYAVEAIDADGAPNGDFYLTKDGAKDAASEIVETHLGYTGDKADAFINANFERAWNHADLLKNGFLTVEEGPAIFKSMLGEVEANNEL